MIARTLLSAALALSGMFTASAHQVDTVELEFLRTDGTWKLEGLLDIAYMMPESRGVEGAPPMFRADVMAAPPAAHKRITDTAEATMRKLLTLSYNEREIPWEIRFPDFEKDPLELPPEEGGWALMRAEITTPALPGPGRFGAAWHDDLNSELIVIIEEGGDLKGLFPISSGMSQTLLTVEAGEGAQSSSTPSRGKQAENWIYNGFGHVIAHDFFGAISSFRVPEGLDHLLFILGLFLLAPRWKPLMGQSLLFTLAHSITLALAIFGFISLPSRVVEILIAASIAWIGIENLILRELKVSRLFLVFGFGLLHGMGFASMLRDKIGNLGGSQLALPLIGFNVGVELAQVTVLAVAFLILWPLRKWTRQIQLGGSVFVALAGIFWMFERIFA
ncbi:HupE/UreJ family protein [Akkermansiaceae bacterium]|nr:HupE/UreJ family protein [Akkermansiaceae bacterium]